MKKRIIAIAAAAALLAAGAFSATAFAGGPAEEGSTTGGYALCTVVGCTRVGPHAHSGNAYTPRYQDNGHKLPIPKAENMALAQGLAASVPAVCPVQGCTQTQNHRHDGVLYLAHHGADGHEYHNHASAQQGVCPIAGCTATGNHTHNGGQHHNAGGHTRGGGTHHGGHH
ncbi:hypothetical protein LJC04_06540 [Ruminococcaceae bacterium OttesenSCG-928-O06]|nr:hypothetical protein [Ruminococcaceae bacterium OttesenSCG-928-O06]